MISTDFPRKRNKSSKIKDVHSGCSPAFSHRNRDLNIEENCINLHQIDPRRAHVPIRVISRIVKSYENDTLKVRSNKLLSDCTERVQLDSSRQTRSRLGFKIQVQGPALLRRNIIPQSSRYPTSDVYASEKNNTQIKLIGSS